MTSLSPRMGQSSEMRPIHELHSLDTDILLAELGEVCERLDRFLSQEAVATIEYERANVNRYFSSMAESHAAKQREADHFTLTERDDVLTFAREVKGLTAVRDHITKLIDWRIYGKGAPRIQGGSEADNEEGRILQESSRSDSRRLVPQGQ
jgi:hypothetical protein